MKFTQHVPGFVDVSDENRVTFEFHTKEELLDNEFVKNFACTKENQPFRQFSLTKPTPLFPRSCLKAEYGEDTPSWIVGFIEGTAEELASLDLPEYKPH